MNKLLKVMGMGAGMVAGFFVPCEAGLFDKQSDAVYVNYASALLTNTTAALVIDLSDVTNYPHGYTGSLKVVALDVVLDQVAAGTSTVKLGVVTGVNASSGTVRWFQTFDNTVNVSATNKSFRRYWVPSELDLRVSASGGTPGFATKDVTTITPVVGNPLLYQNDIAIQTAAGATAAAFPDRGDMVMEVQASPANGVKVNLGVLYYAIP